MVRVSETGESDGVVTLRLEGMVIGSDAEEIRRVIEKPLAAGFRLALDLAELSFLDRNGIAMFRELANRQIEFLNCSPFLTEQLKDVINQSGEQR